MERRGGKSLTSLDKRRIKKKDNLRGYVTGGGNWLKVAGSPVKLGTCDTLHEKRKREKVFSTAPNTGGGGGGAKKSKSDEKLAKWYKETVFSSIGGEKGS